MVTVDFSSKKSKLYYYKAFVLLNQILKKMYHPVLFILVIPLPFELNFFTFDSLGAVEVILLSHPTLTWGKKITTSKL